ncbi:MAG: hypothetical protein NTW96_15495 [Planctomycetia bacterium]|nr:hypothetical protein [Planctomycetia bacterium]
MYVSLHDRRKRVCWLVAAHLLLGAIGGGALHVADTSWFVTVPAGGLWLAQGSLLGVWAAFGGAPRPWRLITAAAALVALGWLLPMWLLVAWTGDAFLVLVCGAVPLLAARFLGLRLDRFGDGDSAVEPWRGQYSLRLLLEWTLGFAALLSLFQLMPREFVSVVTPQGMYRLLVVVFFDTALVVAICLLGLGWPRIVRLAAIGAALLAVGIGRAVLPGAAPRDTLAVGVVLSVQAAIVLGSLLVFRAMGYRLVWRNRRAA